MCCAFFYFKKRIFAAVLAQGNLTTGRVFAGNMSAAGAGNYNYTDQDGSLVVNKNVNTDALVPAGATAYIAQ